MTDARLKSFADRIDRLEEERKAIGGDVCTYIVRVGTAGPVKIGRAKHVPSRIAALQTSNAEQLHLLRVTYGDDEAAFHRQFAHRRIRGEWFAFDHAMLTFQTPDDIVAEEYRRLLDMPAIMVAADIGLPVVTS